MSIRSANYLIKNARLKAGYTQEQMSAGICSLQALSKIELGLMGVSSATFQTLMERAGASCERFPLFANRMDFEIYYALKLARTYLDINDFSAAYERLVFIQQKQFAANRLNYQEWLLLVALLKTKSHCASAEEIKSILIHSASSSSAKVYLQPT